MAEVPICDLCGTRHLAHQAHSFSVGRPTAVEEAQGNVTPRSRDVPRPRRNVTRPDDELERLRAENAALRERIAVLEAAQASARQAGAARVRKSRAKRRT